MFVLSIIIYFDIYNVVEINQITPPVLFFVCYCYENSPIEAIKSLLNKLSSQ